MSIADALLLVFGGLAAGVINTMAGGGSTITVPLLVLAGVPGTQANGSNRVGVLAASAAAVISFRRLGVSGIRKSSSVLLPVLVGSLIGSSLISQISDEAFERLFGVLMVPIVILTLVSPTPKKNITKKWGGGFTILIFSIVGLYGGAIQAGVGLLMIIALSYSGFDLVKANSIKVLVNVLLTIVALPVFLIAGKVDWGPALTLAAGFTLGGWLGAKWAFQGGEKLIRFVMVISAVLLSGRLLGFYG
ncbi:MAG: TSUP family transporter [Actinomycetota bacterium]|nr:TSUP family transporter [Actinomycetota bacterium]